VLRTRVASPPTIGSEEFAFHVGPVQW
jgi:hypothetical protein